MIRFFEQCEKIAYIIFFDINFNWVSYQADFFNSVKK